MKVMLYGVGRGNGSWARVTAGVREGLEACGALAGFYDVERVDVENALEDGFDAPIGLCVGSPPTANVMVGRGVHARRMLMIAANSSWLPGVIMDRAAKVCTEFVAPSAWSADVIGRYAAGRPVLVYPHGVEQGFKPVGDGPPAGHFRALHLASTHMERKGTKELIHGWVTAVKRGAVAEGARLRLVIDGPRGLFNHVIFEACEGSPELADTIELSQRLDLKVWDMAALYCDHHLVVQPSRAEGFGMVPLEARACGVPVVMTTCTGHGQHVGNMADIAPGMVRIEAGEEDLVDDGPGALAPTVSPDAIADALAYAAANIEVLRAQAAETAAMVRQQWSWEAVTRAFLTKNEDIFGAQLRHN
jgi:glycosyltransferase involved in cell wall biosynthesis